MTLGVLPAFIDNNRYGSGLLVLLAFLPDLLPVPFLGILISVMVYAVSSGLVAPLWKHALLRTRPAG